MFSQFKSLELDELFLEDCVCLPADQWVFPEGDIKHYKLQEAASNQSLLYGIYLQ